MTVQIILTAIGLAMDAFAVSVTNGMCNRNISPTKNALSSGITFGMFQGIMPLIGFIAGSVFKDFVKSLDHWIALILLCGIGGKMIYDGIQERRNPETCCNTEYDRKTLILQGIATSIDALAIGIGFAVIEINIWIACLCIGIVTFLFSVCGVRIGHKFGGMLKDKAQFIGGIILILIGLNIFYEHAILGIA